MYTFHKISSLTLLSILIVFSQASFAGKENNAGSDCVLRSGGPISYSGDGAVINTNAATANILCHVPHTDFDGFLNAGEIDSGFYEAVDLNNGANITCRFRSVTLLNNGSVNVQLGTSGSTAGFGTQRQSRPLGGVGENSNSAYVLACSIPPHQAAGDSKIQVYSVTQ